MFKDWGKRLEEKNRPIPVSAFATELNSTVVSNPSYKKCDHIYRYLKSVDEMDIFYCEKCLDYKQLSSKINKQK